MFVFFPTIILGGASMCNLPSGYKYFVHGKTSLDDSEVIPEIYVSVCGMTACISLIDCKVISGCMEKNRMELAQEWVRTNRDSLLQEWNYKTRLREHIKNT